MSAGAGRYKGDDVNGFVWVFEISGAVPPAHLVDGYRRLQSANASPRCTSGSAARTVKGISKPGNIVWSRVYVEDDRLQCDLGLGEVVRSPAEETAGPLEPDHGAVADHARRPEGRLA